jgi:hypothetical protein
MVEDGAALPLATYAAACAGLDCDTPESDVFDREDVDADTWPDNHSAWQRMLGEDEKLALEFQRIYAEAQAQYLDGTRPRAPRRLRGPVVFVPERFVSVSPPSMVKEDAAEREKGHVEPNVPWEVAPSGAAQTVARTMSLPAAGDWAEANVAPPPVLAALPPLPAADPAAPKPKRRTTKSEGSTSKSKSKTKTRTRPKTIETVAKKEDAPPDRVLSLLEFASVSMGLEIVPDRAAEVFKKYGLDEKAGAREVELWTAHLASSAAEEREFRVMRARMHDYWVQFSQPKPEGAPVAPTPRAVPRVAAAPAPAPPSPPPSSSTTPRMLTMLEYAAMTAALELAPQNETQIHERHGLRDEANRRRELEAWRMHLASDPSERTEFERLHARFRAELARGKQAPSSGGAPRSDPTISLLEYAIIFVELERAPHNAESIFAKHGLADPAVRHRIDSAWKQRLQANPDEMREWTTQVDRMRRNWVRPLRSS